MKRTRFSFSLPLAFAVVLGCAASSSVSLGGSTEVWSELPLRDRITRIWKADATPVSGVYIRYVDSLGDGPGTWDPRPKTRTAQELDGLKFKAEASNCINWTFETLARAYAPSTDLKTPEAQQILDQIRYYGGKPAWGLRKHFVDQMLNHAPAPWISIPDHSLPHSCQKILRTHSVNLDVGGFAARSGYECPLPVWGDSLNLKRERISFRFLDGASPYALTQCLKELPSGLYGLFAVASQENLEVYGEKSGEMGRAHSGFLVLEQGPARGQRSINQMYLYHASIRADFPSRERIDVFQRKTRKWFRGIQLFRLPEHWSNSTATSDVDPAQLEAIRRCERSLVERGSLRKSLQLD